MISDQNIFLAENSFFVIFLSIKRTPHHEQGKTNVISTADQNMFLAEKDLCDFPPVHQGVISGGDCLWPLNIQTN